jgi:hypothetical protein
MQKLKEILHKISPIFFRRAYFITIIIDEGEKMYYKGIGDVWTSDIEEAYKYQYQPDFMWLNDAHYNLEEYYF